MTKHNLRPVIPLIIVVFLIASLLVAGAFSVFTALKADSAMREQTQITADVVREIRRIEVGLVNAETGQRGYLITGDESYLEPYYRGLERYRKAVVNLRKRIEPYQDKKRLELVNRIEENSEAKIAELDQTIELVRAGQRSEALVIVNTDYGQDLMITIQKDITEIYNMERGLLDNSLIDSAAVRQSTFNRLMLMGIGVLGLLAGMIYLTIKASQLNETRELLEQISLEKERSDLLSKELNHRVKNLFAIISSIVRLTGYNETDVKSVITKINSRVNALSRAHSLTVSGESDEPISLRGLIDSILAPHLSEMNTCQIYGPKLILPQHVITPLGLTLHELATNAIKYGAWSGDAGNINISWISTGTHDHHDHVELKWNESVKSDERGIDMSNPGFGNKMIDMSIRQLGGTISRNWNDGLEVVMTLKIPSDTPRDDGNVTA